MKTKRTKKQIAKIIAGVVTGVICIVLLLLAAFSRQLFGDEVGDLILGKGVDNGFILIGNFIMDKAGSLALSALSILFCLILYLVLNIIIKASFKKTPRRLTIGSLLKSLVKYLIVVLGICLVLGSWKVNVAAIFAGVGVLTLVIGLGCKSLVNDIVSGFFIVVDNYFQVGDKVTIDGFTGIIDSVGLRATKIKSWDGNIKSINNSIIVSVVNLSCCDSVACVKIDISFNEDLVRAEAIIAKNLDKIRESIPSIIGPISYGGVDALDDCGVLLAFTAPCKESNRVKTQRELLRALYLLFTENDLIIPFKQIVVNEPDPTGKPRSNENDVAISRELRYPSK